MFFSAGMIGLLCLRWRAWLLLPLSLQLPNSAQNCLQGPFSSQDCGASGSPPNLPSSPLPCSPSGLQELLPVRPWEEAEVPSWPCSQCLAATGLGNCPGRARPPWRTWRPIAEGQQSWVAAAPAIGLARTLFPEPNKTRGSVAVGSCSRQDGCWGWGACAHPSSPGPGSGR